MSEVIVYKIGHTTRIPCLATKDGAPLLLATCTIIVHLENGSNLVTLSLGSGIGLLAGGGEFWFEVTVANLTALGNPAMVLTTCNIWNADNTLALTGSGNISCKL